MGLTQALNIKKRPHPSQTYDLSRGYHHNMALDPVELLPESDTAGRRGLLVELAGPAGAGRTSLAQAMRF